jgi:hypothetical protein
MFSVRSTVAILQESNIFKYIKRRLRNHADQKVGNSFLYGGRKFPRIVEFCNKYSVVKKLSNALQYVHMHYLRFYQTDPKL